MTAYRPNAGRALASGASIGVFLFIVGGAASGGFSNGVGSLAAVSLLLPLLFVAFTLGLRLEISSGFVTVSRFGRRRATIPRAEVATIIRSFGGYFVADQQGARRLRLDTAIWSRPSVQRIADELDTPIHR